MRAVGRVKPQPSTNDEPRSATLVGTMPSPTVPRTVSTPVSRAVSAAALAAPVSEATAETAGEAGPQARPLRGKAA